MKPYLILSTLALLATVTSTHAQIIGVQFQGGGTALTATQTAGVDPQDNFNVATGLSGTNLALVNSSGHMVNTTLSFSVNDSYTTGSGATTPNDTLLSGKVSQVSGGTGFTLNNVAAGRYDLYVYTEIDATKGLGEYTVGSTTYEITAQQGSDFTGTFDRGTSTPSSTTIDTANYVEFENIVVPSSGGSITLTTANGSGYYSAPFSALQLVAAPEPATWALMVAGLLAVAGFSRMRRSS